MNFRWHVLPHVFALVCAPVAGAHACPETRNSQFDFAIWNWIVAEQTGEIIGTVTVAAQYRGCVFVEKGRGIGDAAESVGVAGYDPARKVWHQDIVGSDGFLQSLDGQWNGKSMIMTAKDYHSPDGVVLRRVTLTPVAEIAIADIATWATLSLFVLVAIVWFVPDRRIERMVSEYAPRDRARARMMGHSKVVSVGERVEIRAHGSQCLNVARILGVTPPSWSE